MIAKPAAKSKDAISFGPFSLVASERLLTKGGDPVELGARALDVLIALISRPNEVLDKRELISEVWSGISVEEANLRFQIAALRRALGDGQDCARYIATVPGRGYCFVAPISSVKNKNTGEAGNTRPVQADHLLPARLVRIIGRTDNISTLSTQLATSRFVTIVGPGGVGKTTLAVAVAHDLLETFVGSALFIDLGIISDPGMVAVSLASTLGISVRSDDPTPSIVSHLRDKRILLVLDNCEHVVDAVAAVTAQIFRATSQVHLLATSREALRATGEFIYRLEPLDVPPQDCPPTAAATLAFSAAKLFVERAAASGTRVNLDDSDAAVVAGICRKLDGVALAIELAAGRVAALGLQRTAAMLDERLTLLWQGQRTAPPRQRTLQATLDWSFSLLSEPERMVLRRLAVFVGDFTLEAAQAITVSVTADQSLVFDAIESLVSKSMVVARSIGGSMRYRLLATTRSYVLGLGARGAELADLGQCHAAYCQRWLEKTGATWPTLSNALERAPYLSGLGDVRAALEWSFSDSGSAKVGVSLAANAGPVFLAMSLLTECHRWAETAIAALNDTTRGGFEEMHLQAALGLSLMFTRGSTDAARVALNRSLAIAEERGEPLNQLQLLAPLTMYHLRIGDFKTAIALGKRASALSKVVADPTAIALAHSISGISLTHTGDLAGARLGLEAAQQRMTTPQRSNAIYLGFDGHDLAGIFLARTLWLQGYPDQARLRAKETIKDAAATDHPVTLSITLIWAISLFLWMGDLETAEELLEWFIARAETHSLGPYLAVGRGYKGLLAVRRGAAKLGVESLQGALADLHSARYELLTTMFSISLVQGLAAIGRHAEAVKLVGEAIEMVEENGDVSYMAELLRTKADVLLSMPQPKYEDAEQCLTQSLEWSRRQGALAWELRTAVDLAKLWASQGRTDARSLLQPVYARFAEGLDTPDLRQAERLLATLR
ncbi:ATP-binding protein [Bradyrhizobium uaiense]|uniref:Transcriptional regulator n=1 Tax=Bradyrhizobium uaiense TaxID=2594946 RepID=A0A6P1B9Y5_9BRAD|nr:winged helix-turn-helix domain-containing protein [Bradyrhizobium uaiense]NEU95257.1 transcriptional regulator [Bradyrhizobium uaiense]